MSRCVQKTDVMDWHVSRKVLHRPNAKPAINNFAINVS